ncbi:MAG: RluA family pseudouridine synthase, partial [Alphaproteobacteria bacterium]|nr:RluA family pseudouridine synthase [Alphaproteobacteria bacterium]
MSGVEHHAVSDDEAGLRLDRWFRRHFPELKHGRLERLLRKGQVRVDGARAKSGQRLNPGQDIRVPPLDDKPAAKPPRPVDDKVADDLYR